MGVMERLEKTTLPLKSALHYTAREIGFPYLSEHYGGTPQAWRNNLRISDHDRQPTFEQQLAIFDEAVSRGRDQRIRDSLEEIFHCVMVPLPKVDASEANLKMLQGIGDLLEQVGRMTKHIHEAIEDGYVDPDELSMLKRDGRTLYQRVQSLIAVAQEMGSR